MGSFVASEIVKKMVQKDIPVKGAKALLLGFAFKENCPDYRNTRVVDIYHDLVEFGLNVTVFDPWVNKKEVIEEYGILVSSHDEAIVGRYSVIILAVSHSEFLTINYGKIRDEKSLIYDIKGALLHSVSDFRL